MKLKNIRNFNSIEEYVLWKLGSFEKEEKTFFSLFDYMFSENENTMSEISDGYRIKKTTYGEVKEATLKKAATLSSMLTLPEGSRVGLYMDNSLDWIKTFWAILACGYNPLLMNKRLPKDILEGVISEYNVEAVISDSESFSVRTIEASNIPESDGDAEKPQKFGDEVIFMSSGTTNKIKLCAYTAENFYYQLANSADVLRNCKEVARHHEGELKLLALLPFYHVFGFIAVYLWFGFFSRTFVFLKDMNPQTIQNTVKKHGVTHIFAVPMVWEKVYSAALLSARRQGEKTYNKLLNGIKLANKSALARKMLYGKLGEVREKLFGDSIKFLISGGGSISGETLAFYNGIGYDLVNGFGMTEVGITSVELSSSPKKRNLGAIGEPFKYAEYTINEHGQLLIRGKLIAHKIIQGTKEKITEYGEWFNSFDLAKRTKDGYFLLGRSDDLIVTASGENINPQICENAIKPEGADGICLFSAEGEPVLLIQSTTCYTKERAEKLISDTKDALGALGLLGEIHKIFITPDPLMGTDDFKLSRKKVCERYLSGGFRLIGEGVSKENTELILGELEKDIIKMFSDALQKDESEIVPDGHFFTALGGTSLDYFMFSDAISEKYGIDIKIADGKTLYTVNEICEYIKNNDF